MQRWRICGGLALLLAAAIACSTSSGEEQPPATLEAAPSTPIATTQSVTRAAPLTACERFLVVATAREIALDALHTRPTTGQRIGAYHRALAEISWIVPYGQEQALGQGAVLLFRFNSHATLALIAEQLRDLETAERESLQVLALLEEFEAGLTAACGTS